MNAATTCTLLLCLATIGTSQAQETETRQAMALPQIQYASDSDGLNILKAGGVFMPDYRHGLQWRGLELLDLRYAQNGQVLHGQSASYAVQDTDARTGMGYNYRIGYSSLPAGQLVIGEYSLNRSWDDKTNVGLFAARDWVESLPALQRQVHYTLAGANVDRTLTDGLTLVGAASLTQFSDQQQRQQQRLRLVWDVLPEHGITLQWAYRHQRGASNVTERLYFNPESLQESLVGAGWRKRLQGWTLGGRAAWGWQRVNADDSTPARVAEIHAQSPVQRNGFLKLRAGHLVMAGLSGPGYAYRYADLQWIMVF